MTTADVAAAYMNARAAKDLSALRALLADDLHFQDPLDTFTTAVQFEASMDRLFSGLIRRIVEQEALVDGDRAAIFSVWDTAAGQARFAERLIVKDDRVTDIQAYFDARPFARD